MSHQFPGVPTNARSRASKPAINANGGMGIAAHMCQYRRSVFSQKRIAGGALVLAITQLGASVAGLIRDRVLASAFPPGVDQLDTVSVYIAAFRPSDLLIQMFILSGFVAVLTPLIASHCAQGKEEEMQNLLTSVLIITNIFFGAVAALLIFLLPTIAPLLTDFTGERLDLYIQFARLACLSNLFFVTGYAFGQFEVARQQYWVYGLTAILYTLCTIAGALWLTPVYGPYGPMIGTVGGAFLYAVVRLCDCMRRGMDFRFRLRPLWHPELLAMGTLMLAPMAARGALQIQLLFFDKVASGLALGSVTVNAYARNAQAAAVGFIGIALAQSAYSLLSQAAAKSEWQEYWRILKKAAVIAFILSLLALVALTTLGPIAAWLFKLTEPRVVQTFVFALGIYAFSIPFESVNHLLLRAFYAQKRTAIPASMTVLNGLVAITFAWIYAPQFGVYALAGGFLLGQVVEMGMLWGFLRR